MTLEHPQIQLNIFMDNSIIATPDQFLKIPLKTDTLYKTNLRNRYMMEDEYRGLLLKYINDMTPEEKEFQNRIHYNLRMKLYRWMKQAEKGMIRRKQADVKQIGCSIPELRTHLEKQFVTGMTWETYGFNFHNKPYSWFIEHILPRRLFDLSDAVEVLQYMHYTNLRPKFWSEYRQTGKSVYRTLLDG